MALYEELTVNLCEVTIKTVETALARESYDVSMFVQLIRFVDQTGLMEDTQFMQLFDFSDRTNINAWRRGEYLPSGKMARVYTEVLLDEVRSYLETLRKPPTDDELLNTPFPPQSETGLPTRLYTAFKTGDLKTYRDVVQKHEQELTRMPNLGRKSINLLKVHLDAKGLHLGMEF